LCKILQPAVNEIALFNKKSMRWQLFSMSYIAQPAKGHEGINVGIEQFRTRRDLWLDRMLVQPLRGTASCHALDPRNTTEETRK
jgi:hypothetical protein